MLRVLTIWVLFATPVATTSAAEICKSVDEQGNVSFSDCGQNDQTSTRIEASEGPTEAEILEAQAQAKQEMDAFNEITGAPDPPATSSSKSVPGKPASGAHASPRKRREQMHAQQAALDEQCQNDREVILSVERAQYVEECVRGNSRSTREECVRFYADHGDATRVRGMLYMNLPSCVEAHEFRNNRSR